MTLRKAALPTAILLTALLTACTANAGSVSTSPTLTPASPSASRKVSTGPRDASPGQPRTPCRAASLELGFGSGVSPATGEQGVVYTLKNEAEQSCYVLGYPDVTLQDRSGRALAFHYVRDHVQYVTSQPPRRVSLRPGSISYFLVAKYRCDVGQTAVATMITVVMPGGPGRIVGPAQPLRTYPAVACGTIGRSGPGGSGEDVVRSAAPDDMRFPRKDLVPELERRPTIGRPSHLEDAWDAVHGLNA